MSPAIATSPSTLAIEAEIERLTVALTNLLNQRDWAYDKTPEARELLSRVCSDFTAQNVHPGLLDWKQLNEAWQLEFTLHPRAILEVTRISTTTYEEEGYANVLVETEAPHLGGLTFSTLGEVKWKRVETTWMLYGMVLMRGMRG